ncbi:MAG: response regulator [bacterium]|nr:response regulator [bacterium]
MAKILIADDDGTLRQLLENALTTEGHDVVLAEDGKKALESLRNDQLDLAILDQTMPMLKGSEVLVQLKLENGIIPPTIIINAKGSAELIHNCIEAGARDFVLKPFHLPIFLDRVYKLLRVTKR